MALGSSPHGIVATTRSGGAVLLGSADLRPLGSEIAGSIDVALTSDEIVGIAFDGTTHRLVREGLG